MSIAARVVRRMNEAGDQAGPRQRKANMRVIVIVKATRESEAEVPPAAGDETLLREMGAFNEQLVKAGIMLAGEGLRPSRQGKRIRISGAQRTVIDGPFAETKELVAGFWLWQGKSLEEARGGAKRWPHPIAASGSGLALSPPHAAHDLPPTHPP